jgi:hypothetical protein
MSPVWYEMGLYIREDGILHSHRSDNPKSYIDYTKFLKFLLNYNVISVQF